MLSGAVNRRALLKSALVAAGAGALSAVSGLSPFVVPANAAARCGCDEATNGPPCDCDEGESHCTTDTRTCAEGVLCECRARRGNFAQAFIAFEGADGGKRLDWCWACACNEPTKVQCRQADL
jgi:hypothetical protein